MQLPFSIAVGVPSRANLWHAARKPWVWIVVITVIAGTAAAACQRCHHEFQLRALCRASDPVDRREGERVSCAADRESGDSGHQRLLWLAAHPPGHCPGARSRPLGRTQPRDLYVESVEK